MTTCLQVDLTMIRTPEEHYLGERDQISMNTIQVELVLISTHGGPEDHWCLIGSLL